MKVNVGSRIDQIYNGEISLNSHLFLKMFRLFIQNTRRQATRFNHYCQGPRWVCDWKTLLVLVQR